MRARNKFALNTFLRAGKHLQESNAKYCGPGYDVETDIQQDGHGGSQGRGWFFDSQHLKISCNKGD